MARPQTPAAEDVRRSDWSDWSAKQEQKRIEANIAETQRIVENPIYPRELAERIAEDYSKLAYPDWRLLRHESTGLFRRLVRDQPEMKQPELQRRGELLGLLRTALPNHLRPLLHDLELIHSFTSTANEAAAFMVGFSLGKKAERRARSDARVFQRNRAAAIGCTTERRHRNG